MSWSNHVKQCLLVQRGNGFLLRASQDDEILVLLRFLQIEQCRLASAKTGFFEDEADIFGLLFFSLRKVPFGVRLVMCCCRGFKSRPRVRTLRSDIELLESVARCVDLASHTHLDIAPLDRRDLR